MANVRIAAAVRSIRSDLIRAAIDAGAGPGLLKLYSGAQPANADAAPSGNTLLGTLTFTDPSAPPAVAGVLTFSALAQDPSADASGAMAWARVTDSNGVTVFDCDAGTSGTTLIFNTVTVTVGGPIQIANFVLSDPAA